MKPIISGYVDHHGHLFGLGTKLITLRLHECFSSDAVANAVRTWISRHSESEWVVGLGWNQEQWPDRRYPTHEILDRVAPHTPVYLTRIDGHAAWVNAEAMRRAGIEQAEHVDGGMILSDAKNIPTGILIDNAMQRVTSLVPPMNEARRLQALRLAIKYVRKNEVAMVHDMDVDPGILPLMRRVLEEPGYRLGVSSWLRGQDFEWRKAWKNCALKDVRGECNSEFLSVDGIKFYVDGALGSHGAWLSEPYADQPETSGLILLNEQALQLRVDAAIEDGYAVAVHAIGDAAVNCALNVFENIRAHDNDTILRIEHAQVIHPSDIPRFSDMNVIASIQPMMRVSDGPWLGTRLGRRKDWTFPFRALLDSGARLIGGSDFPIEEPDPIEGILSAISGAPRQLLTLQEAQKLFSHN